MNLSVQSFTFSTSEASDEVWDGFYRLEGPSSIPRAVLLPSWDPSIVLLTITAICLLLWNFTNLISATVDYLQQVFLVSVYAVGSVDCEDSCEINNKGYHSLTTWLVRHCEGCQSWKLVPAIISSNRREALTDSEHEEDRPSPEFQYVYKNKFSIGYGTTNMYYNKTWIQVKREILPAVRIQRSAQEKLTISTFYWNKKVLSEILERAKHKPKKADTKQLTIYKGVVKEDHSYWIEIDGARRRKRPLSTLVLNENVVHTLIEDIKKFQKREDWYVSRGIPYKRGYLLFGPPGCGKSSVIKAVAGELDYSICTLSLAQKISDNAITDLFNKAPEHSLILLEDIDAAFKSRADEDATARETNLAFEGSSPSFLTFMGLLNALDGVASNEDGQIVMMTTNYPERLDGALIRPGRVDVKICIDYPTDSQIEGMFKLFYPETDPSLHQAFVKAIRHLNVKVSMALLQNLMVVYPDDPQGAIDNVETYMNEQGAGGSDGFKLKPLEKKTHRPDFYT